MKGSVVAAGLILGVIATGGLLVFGLSRLMPKAATEAELRAELPPDWPPAEAVYPERQARYRALVGIGEEIDAGDLSHFKWRPKGAEVALEKTTAAKYRPMLAKVEALLKQGPLQQSAERQTKSALDSLRNLSQVAAMVTAADISKKDSGLAFRDAELNLHLARAMRRADLRIAAYSVQHSMEWNALNGLHAMATQLTLSAEQRKQMLAELPAQRCTDPELPAVFRRDLRQLTIPYLVKLAKQPSTLRGNSYDARATLKLYMRLNSQAQLDAMDLGDRPWDHSAAIQAEVVKELKPLYKAKNVFQRLSGQMSGNVYGRWWVSQTGLPWAVEWSRELATYQNLVRFSLLAKDGARPALRDGMGHGDLSFDDPRRVVWSVGQDGLDQDGRRPYDLVLRY